MKVKFVASVLMTMLFAAGAAADGKRVLVIMKSQGSYQNAKIVMDHKGQPGQVLDISVPHSVRSLAQVKGQVESKLDRLQSLVLKDATDADLAKLRENPNVAHVEEEIFHALPPKPAGRVSPLLKSAADIGPIQLDRVPLDQFSPGLKTPWGIRSVRAVEAWRDTRGGAGARVLVLDTGIDKDHVALVGNFEAGRDFVGDNQPNYPFNDTHGHGTHVAGTIAGIAMADGFTGVAPEATILAGRVCGSRGCSNIAIAQGVDWGVEQKVDVISMSLGGMWSTPGERLAISRAIEAGVTVVAASGNGGTSRVSFPAALPNVIAVGAIDEQLGRATFSQYGPELAIVAPGVAVASAVPMGSGRESDLRVSFANGETVSVVSSTFDGSAEMTEALENGVVAAGLGKPEEFASLDVKGKTVLILRGEIAFGDKVKNAMAAGARAVVIANNVPELLLGTLNLNGGRVEIPVFGTDQAAGERVMAALQKGENVRLRMAVNRTDYSAMDGTSMATPHVSGVVALMKAANKSLTPAQVREILVRTAKPLGPNDRNEFGAGLAMADAAVMAARNTVVEQPVVTP